MLSNALSGIISITASGGIAGGSMTTVTDNMSSTPGNIHTIQGTVGGMNEVFQHLACTGMKLSQYQTLYVLTPISTLILQLCLISIKEDLCMQ